MPSDCCVFVFFLSLGVTIRIRCAEIRYAVWVPRTAEVCDSNTTALLGEAFLLTLVYKCYAPVL